MFKCFSILFAALLVLLCTGCGEQPAPGSGEGSSPPPAETSAPAGQDRHIELTPEHKEQYATYLRPLGYSGELIGLEPLPPAYDCGVVKDLEVVDAVLGQDSMTLTAEVYGTVLLNTDTGEETIDNGFWVENTIAARPPADAPHAPFVLLGTSVVELRDTGKAEPEVLSCHWQPLENPGRRMLEETSSEFAEQIAASGKPDLSGYDRRLVDYVYKIIASQRLIGGPEDITLWDLENLCTDLSINWEVVNYVPETIADPMEPPPIDAGLLRLMPNLRSFTTYYPLADYGVFGEMKQLESLRFDIEATETPLNFSTLRVGKADTLSVENFRQDIAIDLSGCDVNTLHINSWVASVTELKGCEGIRELEFNNTRSDTRIISAETFPNAEHIRMAFFSDTPRVRDFSRLATFGEDVEIDLTLTYQAANNKTVESLAGVRLDRLTLDPKDGQWPLDEPDPALVEKVKARQVEWLEH